MADFQTIYDGTVGKVEGEYADLPGDSGGRTWKGISENNNPDWPGWQIIDVAMIEQPHLAEPSNRAQFNAALRAILDLESEVRERMKSKYWDVFWGDRIGSQAVAAELYDQTVHFGAHTSIRHLQRVLNALNRKQTTALDQVIDGVYGDRTHHALVAILERDSDRGVVLYLNCLQGARYVRLTERSANSKFEAWLWGFAKRLEV